MYEQFMGRKLMFATACFLQNKYAQYCTHKIILLYQVHLYRQQRLDLQTAAYSLFFDFNSFAFCSVRFRSNVPVSLIARWFCVLRFLSEFGGSFARRLSRMKLLFSHFDKSYMISKERIQLLIKEQNLNFETI